MAEPPFVFGRVAEKRHFVDRDAERKRLAQNFGSLVNTVIISPRRWGKSSLVQRVAQDVKADKANKDLKVCLIDLFNVRSEADFYSHLATGVMRATMSKWAEWVEAVGKFMSHLRPTVSITPDLSSSIKLEMDWAQAVDSPDEILDLVEKIGTEKNWRIVVCIDEFQAIADFAESEAFQRKLRSHWQQHQHVAYCLYGSKRHMMLDLFDNPEMPFYRFGDVMTLDKIDNFIWGDFIRRRFTATGKTITVAQGRALAALVENHSYYVQQLAQQVWFRTQDVCTDEIIDQAMNDLTDQLDLVFTGVAASLTSRQLGFLRAVVDGQTSLYAQATLKAYNLGTSANVARIRDALISREIIDVDDDGVQILDPVFKYWLRAHL